ncbi:Defensin-like protein [Castilleja foliolosa]|uniref:Defensin-like protein n=1 Tax=Castilleja foliolosa TaxID=1961234 RepID=A0ABD3D3J9_9LAMI
MVSISKSLCILFVIILSVSNVLQASDVARGYGGRVLFDADSNKLCTAGLGMCEGGKDVCIAKCNYQYGTRNPKGYCYFLGYIELCYCDYQC